MGWKNENNIWHYYENGEIIKSRWVKDNNRWYYLDSNGDMMKGWLEYKGHKCYFAPWNVGKLDIKEGQAICDMTFVIEGHTYSFDKDCYLIEGYTSKKLKEFIMSFEGYSSKVYKCSSGILTIGYGTTRSECVAYGFCTKEQAVKWFDEDIEIFVYDLLNNNVENVINIIEKKYLTGINLSIFFSQIIFDKAFQ